MAKVADEFDDDFEDDDLLVDTVDPLGVLEDDIEDEDDGALTPPPRPTGSLALRRAIELRMEQRQMEADLNYLEYDFDD